MQRRENVVLRLCGNLKMVADSPGPFPPRKEDCWRIVDDGALKCRNAGLVGGVVGSVTDGIKRRIGP